MIKYLDKILFWSHLFLILAYLLSGLVFSFWAVLFVSFLHRLHLRIFNGCILSKLQIKLKHFSEDLNFFQVVVKKLLKKEIGLKSADYIGYSVFALSLFIALIANYL